MFLCWDIIILKTKQGLIQKIRAGGPPRSEGNFPTRPDMCGHFARAGGGDMAPLAPPHWISPCQVPNEARLIFYGVKHWFKAYNHWWSWVGHRRFSKWVPIPREPLTYRPLLRNGIKSYGKFAIFTRLKIDLETPPLPLSLVQFFQIPGDGNFYL